MSDFAVRLDAISVRYRLAKEKPKTLQEYLVQRIKGTRLVYEDFWALRDVTVRVRKGEALGIIGNNGAGKSTLLKVIAGVMRPTDGTVAVNGKIAPLIELGAGFDMELTGRENIYLNASILGMSKREIDKRFDRIVDFSELREFIHVPLRNYSSGMIARLGFSIATEVDPDILIVDEILSVGDEHFKRKCDDRMNRFRERNITMLLVSHTLTDIRRHCSTVLWLDHGIPRMYGEPESVTDAYQKVSI